MAEILLPRTFIVKWCSPLVGSLDVRRAAFDRDHASCCSGFQPLDRCAIDGLVGIEMKLVDDDTNARSARV